MKVMWAFEPFHQTPKSIKEMSGLLKQFAGTAANTEMGFIVTRSEPELYLAYDIPARERFSLYPKKIVQNLLRKARVQVENKNLHIIDFDTISNTAAVDRFLALATSRSADLIALYCHARKGYMRFMLGSFAETAIHRSKINLLLINPLSKLPVKIKSILFACDFAPATRKYLKKCIEICIKTKARLTVFHVAEVMYRWSLDESNQKIHTYRKKVKQMCQWIDNECKTSGVSCEVVVTTEIKPLANLLLNAAGKANADLIIVVAKVGPVGTLMGGSTTRQLVRSSTKPVLVLK